MLFFLARPLVSKGPHPHQVGQRLFIETALGIHARAPAQGDPPCLRILGRLAETGDGLLVQSGAMSMSPSSLRPSMGSSLRHL